MRHALRSSVRRRLCQNPAIRIPLVCNPNGQYDELLITNFMKDAKPTDTDASQPPQPSLERLTQSRRGGQLVDGSCEPDAI